MLPKRQNVKNAAVSSDVPGSHETMQRGRAGHKGGTDAEALEASHPATTALAAREKLERR